MGISFPTPAEKAIAPAGSVPGACKRHASARRAVRGWSYAASSTSARAPRAYDRVLAPALVEVSVTWRDGRVSFAQDHQAPQRIGAAVRDITRLVQRDESDARAVIACFIDEEHEIGALGTRRIRRIGLRRGRDAAVTMP
jgi:hypothetical protein